LGYPDRREFAAARSLLENAVGQWPRVVLLRVALADVLLLEGRDWAAAENALRGVLALAPDDAPAQSKLLTLLRQQGRANDPTDCRSGNRGQSSSY